MFGMMFSVYVEILTFSISQKLFGVQGGSIKWAGAFSFTYSLYMYEYDSPVGASVFAWVFLRISCRSRSCEKR